MQVSHAIFQIHIVLRFITMHDYVYLPAEPVASLCEPGSNPWPSGAHLLKV